MLGDSKSATNAQNPWHQRLAALLRENGKAFPVTFNTSLAIAGQTSTGLKNGIDAWLAGYTPQPAPRFVPLNIGANGWVEADVAYVLDALHTKWPDAKILVAGVWARGAGQQVSAGMVASLSATRPYVVFGPDEGVVIEGGDNGVTNTYDGQHYSATGAQAWAVALYALMASIGF